MKKVYSHQDVLCLQNQGDITLHEGCHGAENTIIFHHPKRRISTIALAVSAVISGMLYSSGAVGNPSELPNPVSETIAGTFYVSIGENATPRDVNEEINYHGDITLYGNIADSAALGPVTGKIFNIGSKFTYAGSNPNNTTIKLYAGHSKNVNVSNNILNFLGKIETANLKYVYLYGGQSTNGTTQNAQNNIVNITGSISVGDMLSVFGAEGIANTVNNSVTISKGTLSATGSAGIKIYGGYSAHQSGFVNNNSVTISGGTC